MLTRTIKEAALALLLAAALIPLPIGAPGAEAAGLLTPKESATPLAIKDHQVKVIIEDGYAVTTVDQVFVNPHGHDLEAVYSFPVPKKGAVSQFSVWIDGKRVDGEVLAKEKAREVYEAEKAAGRDTGIAEKDAYKTFDISVYPVRAKSETKIRFGYIQPAHVDTGMGQYLYPLEEGGVDEQKMSFWTMKDEVTGRFSFDLTLRSAVPVDAIRLPAHPGAQIVKVDDSTWTVHIDNHQGLPTTAPQGDKEAAPQQGQVTQAAFTEEAPITIAPQGAQHRLDKDIAVYFRHAPGVPASVDLIAHRPDQGKPGTFMMTITPGDDLRPIVEGSDWIFVLDISGSMQGKYASLAEGVTQALGQMRPNDRFRIVLFNNQASELTNGYINATRENVAKYANKVVAVGPKGGTNLFAGIDLGLKRIEADRTSSVVLVTDGVANVGVTEIKNFVNLVKKKDVRFFTFIMGNSANKPLLSAITQASHGFSDTVSNSDDIIGKVLLAKSKVTHQAFHDVKVAITGVRTADMEPQTIGSLYRGQQLVLFGHYFGGGEADVKVTAKVSGEKRTYTTRFNFPDQADLHPEIERLWAFAAIEGLNRKIDLFGKNNDTAQAITDLGVAYGLVTEQTSMVVVKEEIFDKLGIKRTNRDRIAKEEKARANRAGQKVASRRVDKAAPMFKSARPSLGGGGGGAGAAGPWALIPLTPLALALWRKRQVTSA